MYTVFLHRCWLVFYGCVGFGSELRVEGLRVLFFFCSCEYSCTSRRMALAVGKRALVLILPGDRKKDEGLGTNSVSYLHFGHPSFFW